MKYPTIDKDNYPLGFLYIKGDKQPDIVQGKIGTTTYTTHARQMALFQKEALGFPRKIRSRRVPMLPFWNP